MFRAMQSLPGRACVPTIKAEVLHIETSGQKETRQTQTTTEWEEDAGDEESMEPKGVGLPCLQVHKTLPYSRTKGKTKEVRQGFISFPSSFEIIKVVYDLRDLRKHCS